MTGFNNVHFDKSLHFKSVLFYVLAMVIVNIMYQTDIRIHGFTAAFLPLSKYVWLSLCMAGRKCLEMEMEGNVCGNKTS